MEALGSTSCLKILGSEHGEALGPLSQRTWAAGCACSASPCSFSVAHCPCLSHGIPSQLALPACPASPPYWEAGTGFHPGDPHRSWTQVGTVGGPGSLSPIFGREVAVITWPVRWSQDSNPGVAVQASLPPIGLRLPQSLPHLCSPRSAIPQHPHEGTKLSHSKGSVLTLTWSFRHSFARSQMSVVPLPLGPFQAHFTGPRAQWWGVSSKFALGLSASSMEGGWC